MSLSDNIQNAIKDTLISAGHARCILSFEEDKRDDLLNEIIKKIIRYNV